MYAIQATIEGVAPLLQHRYPMPELNGGPPKKQTGKVDYSEEWREHLYVTHDGEVYQPARHIEAAMARAAKSFKVPGKRGATYGELAKAAIFVEPDAIGHGVARPDELTADPTQPLYLDAQPVIVNRARIVRIRPAFRAGWRLSFTINILDDQLPLDVVNEILTQAGRSVGIGDFRPRYGRFIVAEFNRV